MLMNKKDFCQVVLGKTIVKANCDCVQSEDWCQTLTLTLDDGMVVNINSGQEMGEDGLFFEKD